MQILHGISISDRASVKQNPDGTYTSYLDGQPLAGTSPTGAMAVRHVAARMQWLQEQAKIQQQKDDIAFIKALATKLGATEAELNELIEIAIRRNKEQDK